MGRDDHDPLLLEVLEELQLRRLPREAGNRLAVDRYPGLPDDRLRESHDALLFLDDCHLVDFVDGKGFPRPYVRPRLCVLRQSCLDGFPFRFEHKPEGKIGVHRGARRRRLPFGQEVADQLRIRSPVELADVGSHLLQVHSPETALLDRLPHLLENQMFPSTLPLNDV